MLSKKYINIYAKDRNKYSTELNKLYLMFLITLNIQPLYL